MIVSKESNIAGSDTVLECIEKLVMANVNRLVIVTEEDRVSGIVTVSDMIDFLVLRHSPSSVESCKRNTRASRQRTVSVSEGVKEVTVVNVKRKKTVSECVNVMNDLHLEENKVVIFNRLKSISESDSNKEGHVTLISVQPQNDFEDIEANSLGDSLRDSLGESGDASCSEDTPPPSELTLASPVSTLL